ncbi:MAG: MotA/TolQ/ExbB proton channel family protein, partial [Verrucomicrobiota bacterium]|nr:MotA/TolQ/ExbB proton channel family protein [Verrucomicrobiota bacterium]
MKFIAYLLGWFGTAQILLAQTDPVSAPPAASPMPTTLLRLVESGGWAMVPLALLSVLTLMLIIVYVFTLRRGAIYSTHYMNTAEVLLKKRDYAGLLSISSRHSEAISRVAQRTLDFATKNPSTELSVLREIAETEGSTQAASLQHRIVYLADIGVLAPMIGLLGTVFGIIRSFGTLASRASQGARPELLAAGVSEALIATASGLILGITSMAFYGIFRGRVQNLISDLETSTTHFLAMLSASFKKSR